MAHRHGSVIATRWVACLLAAGVVVAGGAAARPAAGAPRLVWRIEEPARGIPARDEDSLYFLTQRHELAAARLVDGRIRWRIPLDPTSPTFGSRVVVRGDIVVAGEYDLMGVDRRTGRTRWLYSPEDRGGAGMHLGDARGNLVFSGSLTGYLRAVDVRTGRMRWHHRLGPSDQTTVYAPVVSGGWLAATYTVFGAQPVGGLAVVDLRSGRLLWQREVPGSTGASGLPVFAGTAVAAAARDGTIYGFGIASGEVVWTIPPVEGLAGDPDYRPLVVSRGLLVTGSLSGEVSAWDLRTRRLRWRRPSALYSVALRMLAVDDVVYVPFGTAEIVALRARDGRELWRIGGAIDEMRWLPLVDGPLLAAAGSRTLALFRLNDWGRKGGAR